jgi:uncharacterized iron-regulated protein
MDGQIFVIALTAIGCGTGIVCTAIDKIYGERKERMKLAERERNREASLAEERLRVQELHLVELRRQNEQLQKQLEWHTKLLEAQALPASRQDQPGAAAAGEEAVSRR